MAQVLEQAIAVQAPAEVQFGLFRRDGLLCALLLLACILIAHPFLQMGFIDDWSYIKMAQTFAQTGHFAYNGWETPSLGWQVLWGALFSKLLGFSFVHVRLSTLPVAMVSVYIFHQCLVRFGLSRGYAAFGTLTLALSPIFMLLSATYMTDIAGLFCILFCLYLCLRAVSASTDRSALGWLVLAAVTNIALGTARQTGWLGVLVIVPSAAWLLRKRRHLFWSGVFLWLAGAAGVFACMNWFNHQPYFQPESLFPNYIIRAGFEHLVRWAAFDVDNLCRVFLCLLLLLFPVLAAWFSVARSVPRRPLLWFSLASLASFSCLLIACARDGKLGSCLPPWTINVINDMGIESLDYSLRIIIAVLVLASALIFLLHLFSRIRQGTRLDERQRPLWSRLLWLLGPYALGYTGTLVLQRLNHQPLFDRYVLPLQAIGIILLLRCYQDFAAHNIRGKPLRFSAGWFPAASHLALLAFALYSVAGTHDWFALSRARLSAAEEIQRSGVPRTAIQGGWVYDGWTQLEAAGYINDSRIRIPRGAFHPVTLSPALGIKCAETWFDERTHYPAVVPRYFVVHTPLACLASSPFPPVTYMAWMPPFTRHVYVQQRRGSAR